MTKKKIGYFGGTFDPIHLGHLNLAIEGLEKGNFDEVWFCPTNLSPFKTDKPPIEIEHRLKMVELAIEGIPQFKLLNVEASSKKIFYTYETLSALKEASEHQDIIFYLMISEDLLENINQWHKADQLLKEFPLFIASRSHYNIQKISSLDPNLQNKIVQVRNLEISSEEIRSRLKKKLYCQHLMPSKVLDYIYEHTLY